MAALSDSGLAFMTEQTAVGGRMTFREGGLALRTMAPAAMLLGLLLAHTGLELLVDIVKWQA